jgi:hypothetical protein
MKPQLNPQLKPQLNPQQCQLDGQTDGPQGQKATSFFEFWPTWLMYLPVVFQWIFLSIRHRSVTLPFIANPKLTLSGMVGVPKSELMKQANSTSALSILPWVLHTVDDTPLETQATQWLARLPAKDIHFPFVCKPDIGCRGSGVKLIKNLEQLTQCIDSYPSGSGLLAQKLSNWEPEVGIFFVRMPGQSQGRIVSLTQKYTPHVVGDGTSTLGELVGQDHRAKDLTRLYYERHQSQWDTVLKQDEDYRLVFSASHCRGAVFSDVRSQVTEPLTQKINEIMAGLPEFYYGRLDVKFSTMERLQAGLDLEIVEINGASAESIHIWDRNAKFTDAVTTLMWQYRTLFTIGAKNRRLGYRTPGLRLFYKHWRKEVALAKHYPLTD